MWTLKSWSCLRDFLGLEGLPKIECSRVNSAEISENTEPVAIFEGSPRIVDNLLARDVLDVGAMDKTLPV